MSLLTDDEIHAAIKSAKQVSHEYAGWVKDQRIEWGRAVQAAILAKLAGAELPEPAYTIADNGRLFTYPEEEDQTGLALSVFIAAQLHQAYAQGAAAQLAEKPSAWKFKVNKFHNCLEDYCPPNDGYDEGTLKPLYTRREA